MRIASLALLGLSLLAQDKRPDPPEAHQSAYWRGRAKLAEAQIALEAAQREAQAATDALVKDCGQSAAPTITDKGAITCATQQEKK